MPINGESQDTCYQVGQYFAKVLLGKDPLQIEAGIQTMDSVIYGNYSIKSAFDMALYDIAAQHANQPLWKFLGGQHKQDIYTDYTVSIGTPEKMALDAKKIQDQGYPAIKIKLGKNGKEDVKRIAAIRDAVGKQIPLRIDANQGWTVQEAIETLQALAPFEIQHCEEPISRHLYMDLPKVHEQSPIPIMADECCGNHHDAARLIAIKALAEKANLHLQVGAMIESRLAMTAFAHFACCSPAIVHYDFDTALMFREDPVEGGIQYAPNGHIQVPTTPGLGARIQESWLAQMEQIHFA